MSQERAPLAKAPSSLSRIFADYERRLEASRHIDTARSDPFLDSATEHSPIGGNEHASASSSDSIDTDTSSASRRDPAEALVVGRHGVAAKAPGAVPPLPLASRPRCAQHTIDEVPALTSGGRALTGHHSHRPRHSLSGAGSGAASPNSARAPQTPRPSFGGSMSPIAGSPRGFSRTVSLRQEPSAERPAGSGSLLRRASGKRLSTGLGSPRTELGVTCTSTHSLGIPPNGSLTPPPAGTDSTAPTHHQHYAILATDTPDNGSFVTGYVDEQILELNADDLERCVQMIVARSYR